MHCMLMNRFTHQCIRIKNWTCTCTHTHIHKLSKLPVLLRGELIWEATDSHSSGGGAKREVKKVGVKRIPGHQHQLSFSERKSTEQISPSERKQLKMGSCTELPRQPVPVSSGPGFWLVNWASSYAKIHLYDDELNSYDEFKWYMEW